MVFSNLQYLFFAGILSAKHALSEEIILNGVRMGGRTTIKVTLASSVDFKWFQVHRNVMNPVRRIIFVNSNQSFFPIFTSASARLFWQQFTPPLNFHQLFNHSARTVTTPEQYFFYSLFLHFWKQNSACIITKIDGLYTFLKIYWATVLSNFDLRTCNPAIWRPFTPLDISR